MNTDTDNKEMWALLRNFFENSSEEDLRKELKEGNRPLYQQIRDSVILTDPQPTARRSTFYGSKSSNIYWATGLTEILSSDTESPLVSDLALAA